MFYSQLNTCMAFVWSLGESERRVHNFMLFYIDCFFDFIVNVQKLFETTHAELPIRITKYVWFGCTQDVKC